MKQKLLWMIAAILICGPSVFTSCSVDLPDNPTPNEIDLGTVTNAFTVEDGATLTGTLTKEIKITVADGASITLEDVSINEEGEVYMDSPFSGITCLGDATITLSGVNIIRGFNNFYPAIFVPEGHTLTIQGDGELDVSGSGTYTVICAAIGSVRAGAACGNLVFLGGTIYAQGGDGAAAIGASYASTCGDITIGGTASIFVDGGRKGAGIGTGMGPYEQMSICGDITIGGEALVMAEGSPAIGAYYLGRCGNITIGEDAQVFAEGIDVAPGIGCGNSYTWCKTITISGGTVFASCEDYGPGIGTSFCDYSICEGINITGGFVLSVGGEDGPAIGSGPENEYGVPIVITSDVDAVFAVRGSEQADFIGAGVGGTRGSVTIDGVDDATPENEFPNFESAVEDNRWSLINKKVAIE